MPHRSTPVEQTWPARAVILRRAAEIRERRAAEMRAQADELERRWRAYVAERDASSVAS